MDTCDNSFKILSIMSCLLVFNQLNNAGFKKQLIKGKLNMCCSNYLYKSLFNFILRSNRGIYLYFVRFLNNGKIT